MLLSSVPLWCPVSQKVKRALGILQANIAMDEDKKEERKKGDIDRSKLEADIKACKDTASTVLLAAPVQ